MNDIVKNDIEVKKILKSNNYGEVYELLNSHIRVAYSNDPRVREITDKIFIKYLDKIKSEGKDYFVYEKALFDSKIFLNLKKDTLKQLLEKDIDVNCYLNPIFNGEKKHPDYLSSYLANQIRDNELMGVLIDKLDCNKLEYNMLNGAKTNLFIMNMIAGRFSKSLELIDNERIDFIDNKALTEINDNFSISDEGIKVPNFNPLRDDYLIRCINELTMTKCISREQQVQFLKRVLYSRKVKMFNVDANLYMLSDLLPEDDYDEFVNYLKTDAKNGNVVLYKHEFDLNMQPTLYKVSSRDFEKKYLENDYKKVFIRK